MKRAYAVFIAAIILVVVGIGLIVPSVYTASSLLKSVSVNDLAKVLVTHVANNTQVEPVPKDASLYDTLKIELKNLIIKQFKNTVSKENESSAQELSLKKLAFHLGLYSLIILIGIILIVNGIISFVAGTIIFVYDRRKSRHSMTKTS